MIWGSRLFGFILLVVVYTKEGLLRFWVETDDDVVVMVSRFLF